MSETRGLGKLNWGSIGCGEGDVGGLPKDDTEPRDKRRKATRGFVDEGVTLDTLKRVGEIDGEEAEVRSGCGHGEGNFVKSLPSCCFVGAKLRGGRGVGHSRRKDGAEGAGSNTMEDVADRQWADTGASILLKGDEGPSPQSCSDASGQPASEVLG